MFTFKMRNTENISSSSIKDINLVKLGTMNIGNKGAVTIIIEVNNTLIEISNCHLSAGFG